MGQVKKTPETQMLAWGKLGQHLNEHVSMGQVKTTFKTHM